MSKAVLQGLCKVFKACKFEFETNKPVYNRLSILKNQVEKIQHNDQAEDNDQPSTSNRYLDISTVLSKKHL